VLWDGANVSYRRAIVGSADCRAAMFLFYSTIMLGVCLLACHPGAPRPRGGPDGRAADGVVGTERAHPHFLSSAAAFSLGQILEYGAERFCKRLGRIGRTERTSLSVSARALCGNRRPE
jgi:hypothetical protein